MYDKVDIYNELFTNLRPDYPIIWATLEVLNPNRIAEYGAGSGRIIPLYKQTHARKIIGLDLEKNMVESFIQNGNDEERIVAYCQNICDITAHIKDVDIVIMTSSVMKHIEPNLREKAWESIYQSLGDNTIVLIDHCEYIYDQDKSTDWQSYFDTLKFWWAEEYMGSLKNFVWKKEINDTDDILYYKNIKTKEEIRIKTYIYEIDDIINDIEKVNLQYIQITNSFTYPYSKHQTKRFISLLTNNKFDKNRLLNIKNKIIGLLDIED